MTIPKSGFPYYISLAGDNWREKFYSEQSLELFKTIDEKKACYRYAEGKWSIKEVLGHITDHERIMTYRALRFSRKDETVLAGYDQNLYVANSNFDQISWSDLVMEFAMVRSASQYFIKGLSADQLNAKGIVWIYEPTVTELLQATVGHEIHHINVLREKYL